MVRVSCASLPLALLALVGCRSSGTPEELSGRVEILSQSVVEATSDTGAPIRKLVLRWKNVGTTPITTIVADVTTLDAQGRVTDEDKDVSLYALPSPVQPGETHEDSPSMPQEGVWMYRKTAGPPASARIVVTYAGGSRP